ncbi:hypothetical protein O988_02624 [Pseudogymnoascus sp. VKM F-3808]|nr:hypothetical protein O988_02624 [Pseudogymnoascus sp. VKM F-3808]
MSGYKDVNLKEETQCKRVARSSRHQDPDDTTSQSRKAAPTQNHYTQKFAKSLGTHIHNFPNFQPLVPVSRLLNRQLATTFTMSTTAKKTGKTQRSAIADVVAREYTIHLHKRLHGVSFKKRAPKAIKEIKAFATKSMGTTDVRLDPQLNKKVWEAGIKGCPYRLRVRISRKRNDEEGATERLYSYVQAVNVKSAKGLQTALVEDA